MTSPPGDEHDFCGHSLHDIGYLELLPREIRFMIFDLVRESIGHMKLVSKSWRAMLEEWLIQENLPELLMIDLNEETIDTMNVAIELVRSEQALFVSLHRFIEELRKKSEKMTICQFPAENVVARNEGIRRLISGIHPHLSEYPYANVDCLEQLASAISTKTRVVWIGRWNQEFKGSRFFDAVRGLLKPLRRTINLHMFREEMNDNTAKFLTDFTVNSSIQRLLSVTTVSGSLSNPRAFMLGMASKLRMIKIAQLNDDDLNESKNFLCADEENWEDVILTMFKEGVRSIDLNNYVMPLFTHEQVRQIVDVLVSINKPFTFSTQVFEEIPRMIEDTDRLKVTYQHQRMLDNGILVTAEISLS